MNEQHNVFDVKDNRIALVDNQKDKFTIESITRFKLTSVSEVTNITKKLEYRRDFINEKYPSLTDSQKKIVSSDMNVSLDKLSKNEKMSKDIFLQEIDNLWNNTLKTLLNTAKPKAQQVTQETEWWVHRWVKYLVDNTIGDTNLARNLKH